MRQPMVWPAWTWIRHAQAAWVHELKGRTTITGNSSRINDTLMGKPLGTIEGMMLCLILWKGSPGHIYKEWARSAMIRTRGALPLTRERQRTIGSIGLFRYDGLAHQTGQKIGRDFGTLTKKVSCAQEAPPYNWCLWEADLQQRLDSIKEIK